MLRFGCSAGALGCLLGPLGSVFVAPRPPRSAPRPRQDRPKTAPRPLQDRPKNAQERLKTLKNTSFLSSGQQIPQVPRPSAQLARLSSMIFDILTSDLTVSQPQRSLKTPWRRQKTAPWTLQDRRKNAQERFKTRKNTSFLYDFAQ